MSYATTLPRPETERELLPCHASSGDHWDCRGCRGAKQLTTCEECGAPYPYHNMYTPVVCTDCDPEAWANPPAPGNNRSSLDREDLD